MHLGLTFRGLALGVGRRSPAISIAGYGAERMRGGSGGETSGGALRISGGGANIRRDFRGSGWSPLRPFVPYFRGRAFRP